MGAGAVGGYFGACLARSGADVVFVARGAHLAALREHGIAVEGGAAQFHLNRIEAVEDPTTIGAVDLILFAVKLWDTDAAIERIRPNVGPHTTVVSLQNGVLKDDDLAAAFGPQRLMGGVCYLSAVVARPGVISRTGPLERLVFGEFDGGPSARAAQFLEACLKAGIAAELSRNIRRDIWEKFVFLVGLSGTTATMRSTIGPIRAMAQTRAFLLDVMREVVAVARAHGVDLASDYAERRLELIDRVDPGMTSSMHRDLENGNRLELRWLSGGVVALGRAAGMATPHNRAIADILTLHADGAGKAG